MTSKKKKSQFGDSDSPENKRAADTQVDPIESHTHCCTMDFDETVRQVSAIKGELGDIATHSMVNTLNQLKYIQAIKKRSELHKRITTSSSQPEQVSSAASSISDVSDKNQSNSAPQLEEPYRKRMIRVPSSENQLPAISSLRPHSEKGDDEEQEGLRQGGVNVLKHSPDIDTSEDNFLFELPRRNKSHETDDNSEGEEPEGRRHSRVFSLKQIRSEDSVDPLTHFVSKNAGNFRKNLGERDVTPDSRIREEEEQLKKKVSNESDLGPEQRLSGNERPSVTSLHEDDNLHAQKSEVDIAPKEVSEDDFPEVLSLDGEDGTINKKVSDDVFTIEMSEDDFPDVASVLVEENRDDDKDRELVVPKKAPEERISEEPNDTSPELEAKESLSKEFILPLISASPKESVRKVESKGTVTEQPEITTTVEGKKPVGKPKVRLLNTEDMKNKKHYSINLMPKQTDSIVKFDFNSKLGNKNVKCAFSGNVSVNLEVCDDAEAKTGSKKRKLKTLELSNNENNKNEKGRGRKVSFVDNTGS